MIEHSKAPEKIQLRQPIRCTVQNTKYILLIMLLGIRKFTELVEYGRKLEKEMKAMLSEIKENVQGNNSDGRKPGFMSMVWIRRKKHSTRTE